MVLVNIEKGAWKVRISLEPLIIESEDLEKAKAMVYSKKPVVTSELKIQSTQKKLEDRVFIEDIIERYENEWKNAQNTKTIVSDMFIPIEKLKQTQKQNK